MSQETKKAMGLFLLAFVCLELALFAFVDVPLSQSFRNLTESDPVLKAHFDLLTDVGLGCWYLVPSGIIVLVAILVWRLPRLSEKRREQARVWAQSWGVFFSSVAVAGITNNLLKALVGRARPKLFDQEALYGFNPLTYGHDWNSFPSGHATNIFAVATMGALFFPRLRIAFFLFAAYIAFSRVIVNAHYLSDVLAGAVWGVFAVLLWLRFLARRGWIVKEDFSHKFPFILS